MGSTRNLSDFDDDVTTKKKVPGDVPGGVSGVGDRSIHHLVVARKFLSHHHYTSARRNGRPDGWGDSSDYVIAARKLLLCLPLCLELITPSRQVQDDRCVAVFHLDH